MRRSSPTAAPKLSSPSSSAEMDRYRLIIRKTGGPEVIEREELGALTPGPGEVLVRHEAIGLNYIDTYHRSGLYPLDLPSGLGSEAAGVVEAAGERADFAPGDRVAYALAPPGAYATHRLIAADRLVRLPEDIDAETAAAVMLKGCTAEMSGRALRQGAGRRVGARPRRGGRGRLDPRALAEGGRRAGDRPCRLGRESGRSPRSSAPTMRCPARSKRLRKRCARSAAARACAARSTASAQRAGTRRWRASGGGADGELRQRLGPGAAVQPARAGARRLALPDPADARTIMSRRRASCRPRPHGCSR